MGKGSNTSTSTTTSELPEFIEPYLEDLLSRSKSVSSLPYVPYGNQRLANFSPDTVSGFDMLRNQANAGTGGLDALMDTAGGISNYAAGPITSTGIPDMDMGAYMNPYMSNVLDVVKNKSTQRFQEQQAGRNAGAVAAGAFGGNRRFVQDALAQRDQNEQLDSINAEGMSAAFDRATGMFSADSDRSLRAMMANEEARRLGSQLGLDATQTGGQLFQAKQDAGFRNAEALSGIGSKYQQREQAGLDVAYQDFTNQRDWPAKQLSLYSQLLSGVPVTPSTTTSTTTPAPSFLSQLAGIGLAAGGIWDMFT